jgi:hypothetical protein
MGGLPGPGSGGVYQDATWVYPGAAGFNGDSTVFFRESYACKVKHF